jgi:hypothetical protein
LTNVGRSYLESVKRKIVGDINCGLNSFSKMLMDFLQFSAQVAVLERKRVSDQGGNLVEQIEELKTKIDQLFVDASKRRSPE